MGRNTEKKPWTNLQKLYKNWSKEIKSAKFCYCKVGSAKTKWGAKEKSPILEKISFLKGTKNYCPCVGCGEMYFSCRYPMSLFSW